MIPKQSLPTQLGHAANIRIPCLWSLFVRNYFRSGFFYWSEFLGCGQWISSGFLRRKEFIKEQRVWRGIAEAASADPREAKGTLCNSSLANGQSYSICYDQESNTTPGSSPRQNYIWLQSCLSPVYLSSESACCGYIFLVESQSHAGIWV